MWRENITHLVENILETLLSKRRALDVLYGAELACETLTLLREDRALLLPCELLDHLRVVAQIDLRADDEAGHTRAVVPNFGEPLLLDVLERRWRGYAEADEEDVRLRIR